MSVDIYVEALIQAHESGDADLIEALEGLSLEEIAALDEVPQADDEA
jgi:hypothetical protein